MGNHPKGLGGLNSMNILTLEVIGDNIRVAFQRYFSRKGTHAMIRRILALLALGVLVTSTSSCFLSPDEKKKPDDPVDPKVFKDLTQKEDVLNNLELAYNKRNITRYDELLDPDFTFFFAPGDVGGTIPDQWGRAEEMSTTTLLFDATLNDTRYPTCRRISMNLQFESGVQWVEIRPEDFPNETWYSTTVFYDFTIEMKPDNTYIATSGSSAEFTVRNVGTIDAPHYQLVEFRDLGDGS